MKNTTRISFIIATFAATGLTASFATASTHTHYKVKDYTANGSAFSYDVCETVGVDFGGSESSTHNGGGAPVQTNTAWGSYYYYNWCTGAQASGYAFLDDGFDGDLNGATIDIEFEADSYEYAEINGQWVYNYLGTQTVIINAELTGDGEVMKGKSSSMSRWGGGFSHYRWSGSSRDASIDLSVTVDGNPVVLPDTFGQLGKANSGSVDVYE